MEFTHREAFPQAKSGCKGFLCRRQAAMKLAPKDAHIKPPSGFPKGSLLLDRLAANVVQLAYPMQDTHRVGFISPWPVGLNRPEAKHYQAES